MESLIGDVPSNWDQVHLGDVCDLLAGPSGANLRSAVHTAPGVPVVMPKNISNHRITADGIAMVEPATAEGLSRYRLAAGDIVCTRTGELGRQALVNEEQAGWLFGTACLRLRPGGSVNPHYLIYYLDHPVVQDWFERNATGSAIASLNTKILGSLPVVVPPEAAQSAIGEVLGALDEKIAIHNQISQTTARLRDALLPSLLAGATPIRTEASP